MNKQDKEAFNKYICSHDQGILQHSDDTEIDVAERAWQAACEYKQKEIDELKNGKGACPTCEPVAEFNQKLEAENAKLRDCIEFYADKSNWNPHVCDSWSGLLTAFGADNDPDNDVEVLNNEFIDGKRARQVLKELDEKL
jgi:hypothetical protein